MFLKSEKIIAVITALIVLTTITVAGHTSHYQEWENRQEKREKELQKNPRDTEALFFLAVAKANLGKGEEALDYFERVSRNHSRALLEDLLGEIKEKLQEDPENQILLNKKGFLHFSLQNYPRAEDSFCELIGKEEENFWLYNFKALSQIAQLEAEKAKETLHDSLDIESSRYTHALLGQIYWSQGNYFRAWRHFLQTGTLLFSIRQSLEEPEVD